MGLSSAAPGTAGLEAASSTLDEGVFDDARVKSSTLEDDVEVDLEVDLEVDSEVHLEVDLEVEVDKGQHVFDQCSISIARGLMQGSESKRRSLC